MSRDTVGAACAELSGTNAKRLTTEIAKFHRPMGSSGYHACTRFVEEALRSYGIDHVDTETYPLDGDATIFGEKMPPAWEPLAAELEVVSPERLSLANFERIPSCLACWSAATPNEGITVEVVDVGTGEHQADFEHRPVAGKAVFVQGTTKEALGWGRAARLAIANGAVGVITDYLLCQAPPWRTRRSVPKAVQVLRLPAHAHRCWAFSLDYPASRSLRRLLKNGRVLVRARVAARTFSGSGTNLCATIPADHHPSQSIFVISHVSAPTRPASNCASGVALAIETARTINVLLGKGRIPRLKRNLKFLFLAEGIGSINYLHQHRAELDDVLVAFNIDSVGHDPGKCNSSLVLGRAPDSRPSFASDYVMSLVSGLPKHADSYYRASKDVSLVAFAELPYMPWGDDRYWCTVGVPTLTMISWPDRFFHTQLLTPDKTSPLVFQRSGSIICTALVDLATMDSQGVMRLERRITARAESRISNVAANAHYAASMDPRQAPGILDRALANIEYLRVRDTQALDSAGRLVRDEPPDEQERESIRRNDLRARLAARVQDESVWLKESLGGDVTVNSFSIVGDKDHDVAGSRSREREVPVKRRNGFPPRLSGLDYEAQLTLYNSMRARDSSVRLESLNVIADEVWNFCDGRRTVGEIVRAVSFEFGFDLTLEDVGRIFQGLSEAGLIEYRREGVSS